LRPQGQVVIAFDASSGRHGVKSSMVRFGGTSRRLLRRASVVLFSEREAPFGAVQAATRPGMTGRAMRDRRRPESKPALHTHTHTLKSPQLVFR